MKLGSILVADRYHPSYFTVVALLECGVDIVSISHRSREVNFNDGIQLGENDHIVSWHKPKYDFRYTRISQEEYDRLPDTIAVREFIIEIEGRDGGKEQAVIVTSITDPTVPQEEISALYEI